MVYIIRKSISKETANSNKYYSIVGRWAKYESNATRMPIETAKLILELIEKSDFSEDFEYGYVEG